jgi:hypothetical protein
MNYGTLFDSRMKVSFRVFVLAVSNACAVWSSQVSGFFENCGAHPDSVSEIPGSGMSQAGISLTIFFSYSLPNVVQGNMTLVHLLKPIVVQICRGLSRKLDNAFPATFFVDILKAPGKTTTITKAGGS